MSNEQSQDGIAIEALEFWEWWLRVGGVLTIIVCLLWAILLLAAGELFPAIIVAIGTPISAATPFGLAALCGAMVTLLNGQNDAEGEEPKKLPSMSKEAIEERMRAALAADHERLLVEKRFGKPKPRT